MKRSKHLLRVVDKRLDASCSQLMRLPGYLSEWGMNKCARQVARSLCAYFDREIHLHRDDQEARLFPVLLAGVHHADIHRMRELIAKFTAEHLTLDEGWKKLRSSLAAIGFCRPAKLSITQATRFAILYRDHVASEERFARRWHRRTAIRSSSMTASGRPS